MEPRKVISVGDLHGDFEAAKFILRSIGVMGVDGEWTGGNTILVQTGDIADRGHGSGGIYRTLFRLQDEAPASGGRVVLLLGNHEFMNLVGNFNFATARETQSLLEGTSERERAKVFSPSGWVGSRLRERFDAVALVGPSDGLPRPALYVHGGVTPFLLDKMNLTGLDGAAVVEVLNRECRRCIAGRQDEVERMTGGGGGGWGESKACDEVCSLLFGDSGPLWNYQDRDYRSEEEEERTKAPYRALTSKDVQTVLKAFQASRMVVGHTMQQDGKVKVKYGGRLLLADTAISAAYLGKSNPSAVVMESSGAAYVLYPDTGEKVDLPNPDIP